MNIDFISDLHIEQWDERIKIKYCNGIIKHFPLNIKKNKNSDYLIVAGDVSDNIDESISFLEKMDKEYKKIIFIDGNHEHTDEYPYLLDTNKVHNKIKDNRIHYLYDNPFIVDNTCIIGVCGWWDYTNNKNINDLTYFKRWIKHFGEKEERIFIDEVIKKANQEYLNLKGYIEKYEKDDNIKNIIIVTHTTPEEFDYDEKELNELDTIINQELKKLINSKYKKIKYWIYGHKHSETDRKFNNIHFLCHPRGRPEDYDRKEFNVKTLKV